MAETARPCGEEWRPETGAHSPLRSLQIVSTPSSPRHPAAGHSVAVSCESACGGRPWSRVQAAAVMRPTCSAQPVPALRCTARGGLCGGSVCLPASRGPSHRPDPLPSRPGRPLGLCRSPWGHFSRDAPLPCAPTQTAGRAPSPPPFPPAAHAPPPPPPATSCLSTGG